MSNKIILKKSAVPGKVPAADDLLFGELAINFRDGKIFYKNADGTVSEISGTGAPSEPSEGSSIAVPRTRQMYFGSL